MRTKITDLWKQIISGNKKNEVIEQFSALHNVCGQCRPRFMLGERNDGVHVGMGIQFEDKKYTQHFDGYKTCKTAILKAGKMIRA